MLAKKWPWHRPKIALTIVDRKASSTDKFYPILLCPFLLLMFFCGHSNHLNDVRIDCDWKVMILVGIEIGWLMCFDLGIFFNILIL